MSRLPCVIFCDFDGTVSRRDVGYSLFRHFSNGRNEDLLPDWKAGRLSTRDCLRMEAEMVHASADEILGFVDRFELDHTFPELVSFCRGNKLPLMIVSEGMDFYIRRLLTRYDLADLTVLSNIGHIQNGGLRIEFPYTTRQCEGCGNCKAARMVEYRNKIAEPCRIIFVGDGYSDACAAREADLVFAKKDLVRYCQAEGISYTAFDNFRDVICRIKEQEHLTFKGES